MISWIRTLRWAIATLGLAPGLAGAKVESTPDGIRFTYVNAAAQAVFLAGDFNGWSGSAQPMPRAANAFTTVVKLSPGDHEYKFVVDGQWFADPDNPVTAGSYGNSLVRVGAQGETLAMEATSNTPLSPKLMLDGRYIGLLIGRRDETNGDRFGVQRPDFNIDFDFKVRMSEALDARVLTKLRNSAEGTPLWETSLRFDRGHLDLHRPRLGLRLFDNDGAGTWEDPLHLVGDIGQYHHEFGYDQQGLRAETNWRGFRGRLLYADSFEAADPLPPQLDTLAVGTPGVRYDFNLGDSNENVIALRVERDLGDRLRLGAAARNDRGDNPGSLSQVQVTNDSTHTRDAFGRTDERWTGGGLDARLRGGERWEAFGEVLVGEAKVRSGAGTRQTFHRTASGFVLRGEAPVDGLEFRVDTSQRWTVGGWVRPVADLLVRGAVERERHGLAEVATDSLRFLRNAALVWCGGVELGLRPRLRVPVKLGCDLEIWDFDYAAGTPWNTQLWFADRNFWFEHFEHRLPVGRYLQLGGDDATTWSPWLEWTVWQGPPLVFRYEGAIRSTRVDRSPKLWESLFRVSWPVTQRLRLYSDTRWVRYDDPVLAIDGGWVSTFAEAAYAFAPGVSVALSWGVDPFVLDTVTNEYAEIGRNEFLIARGATQAVARDRYLNLGSILPRSERALEDERRVQVEAIVKF